MPAAHFYIRVSTVDQADVGFSLGDQQARLERLYDFELSAKYAKGEMLIEEGVSAYKDPLFKRPEGRKLRMAGKPFEGILHPGDVVVLDRHNRSFRNVVDANLTREYWDKHNIKVIIRDVPGANTDTAVGKLILNMLSVIAQFESDQKSEYATERLYAAKYHGQPFKGKAPEGWVKFKRDGKEYLKEDFAARQLMRHMASLRQEGMSYPDITVEAERLYRQLTESPMPQHAFDDWFFNDKKTWRWCQKGEQLERGEEL